MRPFIICLVAVLACSGRDSKPARGESADPEVSVQAVWPGVVLVKGDSTLSPLLVQDLGKCTLRFHLKAGMTNREANDAIDAGYQQFLTCLRTKGRLGGTAAS